MDITNENDKWAHALSAENMIKHRSRLAELEYMRTLFAEYLPVGEDTQKIHDYLNTVEQIIEENGQLHNENFPPEREIIDPESGRTIPYRYNSASLSKQRAIGDGRSTERNTDQGIHNAFTYTEDLDPSTNRGCCEAVQSQSEEPEHLSHVAISSRGEDSKNDRNNRSLQGYNHNDSCW